MKQNVLFTCSKVLVLLAVVCQSVIVWWVYYLFIGNMDYSFTFSSIFPLLSFVILPIAGSVFYLMKHPAGWFISIGNVLLMALLYFFFWATTGSLEEIIGDEELIEYYRGQYWTLLVTSLFYAAVFVILLSNGVESQFRLEDEAPTELLGRILIAFGCAAGLAFIMFIPRLLASRITATGTAIIVVFILGRIILGKFRK